MNQLKYALIITAYNDLDLVKMTVQKCSAFFRCYIHIDKKVSLSKEDKKWFESHNANVIQKYYVNWGGMQHVQAIVDLLRMAEADDCDYVSIISENTVLMKQPQEIVDYFTENKDTAYIEYFERNFEEKSRTYFDFEWRLDKLYFLHWIDCKKKNGINSRLLRFLDRIQNNRKPKKRRFDYNCKGYIYCHLPKSAIHDVLHYKEMRKFINELKSVYVGEELFFQNILVKKYSSNIVNNCLIYDDWSDENELPAFLKSKDYLPAKESGLLFARKVSSKEEGYISNLIKDNLL